MIYFESIHNNRAQIESQAKRAKAVKAIDNRIQFLKNELINIESQLQSIENEYQKARSLNDCNEMLLCRKRYKGRQIRRNQYNQKITSLEFSKLK